MEAQSAPSAVDYVVAIPLLSLPVLPLPVWLVSL